MRLTFFLAWCSLVVSLSGCHGPSQEVAGGVDVVIEGKGTFPEALQGRWRADRDGWEFVFEADGRISSATISMGRVQVVPGQRTTVPTESGGQGVFAPGPWTVHYVPSTGELTVRISMDEVHIEIADGTLEGKSRDVFTGPVDPAQSLWQTEWTTFTDYQVHTKEGLTINLATDPVYGESKLLTFRKVQEQ